MLCVTETLVCVVNAAAAQQKMLQEEDGSGASYTMAEECSVSNAPQPRPL